MYDVEKYLNAPIGLHGLELSGVGIPYTISSMVPVIWNFWCLRWSAQEIPGLSSLLNDNQTETVLCRI